MGVKRKIQSKKRIQIYVTADAYKKLETEAHHFGTSLNAYIAVILSHRQEILKRIQSGEILIVY
jgi:hypothetical protein